MREIYDYVLNLAGENAAQKLANELLDATAPLQQNPLLYATFPGLVVHARHIVVRPQWRILYVVDHESHTCTVLNVVGTRQHI